VFRFLLLPAGVLLALVAVGALLQQVNVFAGVGAVLFAGGAIISWTRQEITRH
jgi:hypothetical protein